MFSNVRSQAASTLKSVSPPSSALPLATLQEVSDCTCLRLRKTARRLTQIYDGALAPAGLTVTQFGILSNLAGRGDLSIGQLAECLGMDPTSLNRTLKPLQRERLIAEKTDPNDKRIRLISVTKRGQSRLPEAIELWKSAQQRVTANLGVAAVSELNRYLDLAFTQ